MMKRIIQILIVGFATCFLMSFLVPRPKPAMENEGTVADWLPVDSSPIIDRAPRFEIIRGSADKSPIGESEPVEMEPGASIVTREIYGQTIQRTFEAKAIRAVDGDTVELLFEDMTHPNCRLASIDCPETGSKNIPGQPYSSQAKELLKSLCVGKTVTVHQTGKHYDRPVAFVVADGVNVNAEMIRWGLAWHALKYSKNEALDELESEAREAKRGL